MWRPPNEAVRQLHQGGFARTECRAYPLVSEDRLHVGHRLFCGDRHAVLTEIRPELGSTHHVGWHRLCPRIDAPSCSVSTSAFSVTIPGVYGVQSTAIGVVITRR